MTFHNAFNGFCMSLADSVPGVSGGTIAFILGFYDRFIDALHAIVSYDPRARNQALRYLFNLGAGWIVGMASCAFLLTSLFEQNIYFMSSFFLGLTVAALPFIVSEERAVVEGHGENWPLALGGAALVVVLSLLRHFTGGLTQIDMLALSMPQLFYVFVSGMLAITAMVLPGISGSTILLIAGVYLPTISAIKEFFSFNLSAIPGLFVLGLGILGGIALSINTIRQALHEHRSQMVYFIIGLMVGSLFAIVMGPTTLDAPKPALSLATFNFFGFILGIAVLFGLELLKRVLIARDEKEARRHVR